MTERRKSTGARRSEESKGAASGASRGTFRHPTGRPRAGAKKKGAEDANGDLFAAAGARPPATAPTAYYDPDCTQCPRLAEFLAETHHRHPDYFARPVPSFGAAAPRLAIV